MVRAIVEQAEAERDRRAKIIHAKGEFRALAEACQRRQDPRDVPHQENPIERVKEAS
jgi:hypothetical protein